MVTQKCHCMGTMGSPTVPLPQAGAKLVPTVSPSLPRSPYLSTTLKRVSLPTTGPSRSSLGLLCGTGGSGAQGAPWLGDLPTGTPWTRAAGPTVALCSRRPPVLAVPWGLAEDRVRCPPMSPHRDCPVPPAFLGCQPPACCPGGCTGWEKLAAVTAQPLPAPRESGLRPLTSPPTYSLSWLRGSVLDRARGRGSQPRSPSGSISPPAPRNWGARSARPVPAGSTASQPRLSRTTGTVAPVKH